jgi:hypothetical protein
MEPFTKERESATSMQEGFERLLSRSDGRLVMCRVDELRSHPSYIRHNLSVAPAQLSALAARGDLAFLDPVVITCDHIVIDGYARWQLARHQGRATLPCLEYQLNEDESLQWILQRHRRQKGLNSFIRILLALDLEPSLQEKARANQRIGGQDKGRSNLTQAQRVVVRSQVASAAGTSSGSVTKVKQLLRTAHPEIQEALRCGEISIHRAWLWSKLPPNQQLDALRLYRNKKGVGKAIRDALARHQLNYQLNQPTVSFALRDVAKLLSCLPDDASDPVSVIPVKVPGRTIFLSEELMEILKLQQQELSLHD